MPHYMNEDRELIRNIAREFAEKEVRPLAAEIDKNETFPINLFKRCGKLGFTSINVQEEYGGNGIDLTTFSIVVEEISKECATLGMCLIAHAALALPILDVGGTVEQKKKWLTPLASGEKIVAYCMTEPSGNADPSTWTCTATKDGNEYVINGTKVFCTNIGAADYYIVKAVTGEFDRATGAGNTHFMVEKGTPGFTVGKIEDKVGWRGSATGTLYFKNVRVPAENLIGPFNQANTACPQAFYYEMTSAGACALGIAEKAFDKTLAYTTARVVKTGVSFLMNFETMRTRIGEMKMDIEAMKGFVYNQSTMIDNGEIDMPIIMLLKPYCFKTSERVCSVAIDLHGGIGVVRETGVEKLWRDAKVGMIGGGQYDSLTDRAAFMMGMAMAR
ncbi:MAG: Acyl-CoA dehydrogenase [Pelotomaculum sp. PtaB.Bin104]|nr:MAG: Acyl-CoA dehydrogenase [Pelotomaculum sp. PtaB.Bin104]